MKQYTAADRFALGQLVKSKAGRDKGKYYFVCGKSKDGTRLLLVDGVKKSFAHPKEKNYQHVQIINLVSEGIKAKIQQQKTVTDEEIRSSFKELIPTEWQCLDEEVGEECPNKTELK